MLVTVLRGDMAVHVRSVGGGCVRYTLIKLCFLSKLFAVIVDLFQIIPGLWLSGLLVLVLIFFHSHTKFYCQNRNWSWPLCGRDTSRCCL